MFLATSRSKWVRRRVGLPMTKGLGDASLCLVREAIFLDRVRWRSPKIHCIQATIMKSQPKTHKAKNMCKDMRSAPAYERTVEPFGSS
jgi:hypothetical protein